MSNDLAPFPDIERDLLVALADTFPTLGTPALAPGDTLDPSDTLHPSEGAEAAIIRTDVETPPNLQTILADGDFLRMVKIDDGDDRFTNVIVVDIDTFGATRQKSRDLAEAVRQWLLGYPRRVGSTVIDRVFTEVGPRPLPWADGHGTWRTGATYRISARR